MLVEQRHRVQHMVRSSSPAERRCSQEAEDGLITKNSLGCDGDDSAFISDGFAGRGLPEARRSERDDESRDDLHAYGFIMGCMDSPDVLMRPDSRRSDAPAELTVRKSFASATAVLKSLRCESYWLQLLSEV